MKCRDRHLWALALCGLRRGEIAGLRWANVDLNPKTVTVSENRMTVGKEIMTGTPKSKASTRTLPMPNEVSEGHASAAFTLSVYAHSQADALQAAARSFGRVVMTTRDTETGWARVDQGHRNRFYRTDTVPPLGFEPRLCGF